MSTKRLVTIVSAAVGALLIAVIVLLVVVRRRTRRGRVEPDCCPPTESAHRTDPKGEQNQ